MNEEQVTYTPEDGSDYRNELSPAEVFRNIVVHGRPYSNAMRKRFGQKSFSAIEQRFHASESTYTIDTKVMRSAGGK